VRIPEGLLLTPPHVHSGEEEIFHILSGNATLWQDGRTCTVSAGDTIVHVARGAPHTLIGSDGGFEALVFGQRQLPETGHLPRSRRVWVARVALDVPDEHPWEAEARLGLPEGEPGERPANVRTFDDASTVDANGGDATDIGAFEVQGPPSQYAASIQQPINADGTSVFNGRRGVVPVKFTFTLGGVATCTLPPATIAVTRTAGGVIGPIDESDYNGSADNGSNFRISNCQYAYNLSTGALGVGTYRVDTVINGQVVGSATFGLR